MMNALRHTLALLFTSVAMLAAARAGAQPSGSERIAHSGGYRYVVAFPDTTKNTFDSRFPNTAYVDKAMLMIYSAVDATVVIRARGFRDTVVTAAGRFSVVTVMGDSTAAPAPIVTEHCKPVDNTFSIDADAPIILYQYLVTKFGTEAWTPIPVEAWGNEHYAAAMPGEIASNVSPGGEFDYNRKNKMAPAEILVIAAYDDTQITIVPNGQILNFCRAENVTLKAGEAYQIQSYVDTLTANVGGNQPDFGGSRIFSTKPVGVISGNTRAQIIDENVGLGKNIFKNMLIEWLAPVEQHGTEFVYMPTWDGRQPTGASNEDPSEKRKAEFVRVYATHELDSEPTYATYTDSAGQELPVEQSIQIGDFAELRFKPLRASLIRTDQPAQAMTSVAAIVKYAGTTPGSGGYIGAAYDGWGGYMVELTPREQWVSFAPFYASTHPLGMSHYVNVVVDTAHADDVYLENGAPFIFQRRIAGTDLIWGSMAVTAGVDHWLEGRNGARFAGFVYGGLLRGGHEEYRPGLVRGSDDDQPHGARRGAEDESADGSGSMPLHPSEYEERLAIAYGYPLAPKRTAVGPGDSLAIRATPDCSGTCVSIEAINDNPVGLRSAVLENAVNARIASQTATPLTGSVRATICLAPVDATRDASATLVIIDRTGKSTRVPFVFASDTLTRRLSRIDFGRLSPGIADTFEIFLRNPTQRAITVASMRLSIGGTAFRILSPTSFPLVVAAQDSIAVRVSALVNAPRRTEVDTVAVTLSCGVIKIPVFAETDEPCIMIFDLDFGTIALGRSLTRSVRITNTGGGAVTFDNPSGGPVLEFTRPEYTVSAADLAELEDTVLTRGQYVDVAVTFTAIAKGVVRDTARLWASTRRCRDTSIWVARVTDPVSAPLELGATTALEAIHPNPTDGATTIRFTLARPGRATVQLFDERGAHLATVVAAEFGAGPHTISLDAASLAPGVYHVRLDAQGSLRSRWFIRK